MKNSKTLFLKVVSAVLLVAAGMITMRVIDQRTQKGSSSDQLIALVDGFLPSRALYTVAELNIADQLVNGPRTADQIAHALDLNADAVHRLLRMLAAHGVFTQTGDRFALNALSELITTNHPHSLHDFLLHEDPERWESYGKMKYTIQTGKPSFNHLFGQGYFDYIARDKKRAEQFDKGMATFSQTESNAIADAYNFAPYNTIVDVGGGVGGLLVAILEKNPRPVMLTPRLRSGLKADRLPSEALAKDGSKQGILYELPHLAGLAKKYVADHGMADRINIVTGSFLESVVAGGDLYILKRILHDWDDQIAVQILKNCVSAMKDDARIVIFDCIVPEGSSYDISKDIDIIMMVIFGGKERTKKDFENVFAASGLKLVKATPIPGTMLSAIEAVKI